MNDPVFLAVLWDKMLARKPSEGVIYAPADAEVTIAFGTGHAYGFENSQWR